MSATSAAVHATHDGAPEAPASGNGNTVRGRYLYRLWRAWDGTIINAVAFLYELVAWGLLGETVCCAEPR